MSTIQSINSEYHMLYQLYPKYKTSTFSKSSVSFLLRQQNCVLQISHFYIDSIQVTYFVLPGVVTVELVVAVVVSAVFGSVSSSFRARIYIMMYSIDQERRHKNIQNVCA